MDPAVDCQMDRSSDAHVTTRAELQCACSVPPLSRTDPGELPAVQLDHIDAVAAIDAEGDRAVRAPHPQRPILPCPPLLQPECPDLPRAVVPIDVAAA